MNKHTCRRAFARPVLLCLLLAGCQSPQEEANEQLIQAIKDGESDRIRAALAAGANPNAVNKTERLELGMHQEQSIMQWAVSVRSPTAIAILAENGGDVRAEFPGSGSALQYLVKENQIDTVRRLLARDASILKPAYPAGADGNTLLWDAVRSGNFQMAKLLLRYGAAHRVALSQEMLTEAARNARPNSLRFMLETNAAFRKPAVLRELLTLAEQQSSKPSRSQYGERFRDTIAVLRQALAKS